jgi:hypothetical protein
MAMVALCTGDRFMSQNLSNADAEKISAVAELLLIARRT